MAANIRKIQEDVLSLPGDERLRLSLWLSELLLEKPVEPAGPERGLLSLAGRFRGGPGDTAERAEEILEAEFPVDAASCTDRACAHAPARR